VVRPRLITQASDNLDAIAIVRPSSLGARTDAVGAVEAGAKSKGEGKEIVERRLIGFLIAGDLNARESSREHVVHGKKANISKVLWLIGSLEKRDGDTVQSSEEEEGSEENNEGRRDGNGQKTQSTSVSGRYHRADGFTGRSGMAVS
jgi:hypothetical protein